MLCQIEAQVRAVESTPSLNAAAMEQRLDIELPGAIRYFSRLCQAVHGALTIARGLEPVVFAGLAPTLNSFAGVLGEALVLTSLRQRLTRFLPLLPAPVGFRCAEQSGSITKYCSQHHPGADPPCAFVDSCS